MSMSTFRSDLESVPEVRPFAIEPSSPADKRAVAVQHRRRLIGLRLPLRRVALLEAVDTAGRVDQLLLAREERVAFRADLDAEVALGRTGLPGFAARAVDLNRVVLRMDFCLHVVSLYRILWRNGQTPGLWRFIL